MDCAECAEMDFERIAESIPYILYGAKVTIFYTGVSFICGFFLGLCLSIIRLFAWEFARYFVMLYVSIFRGTPMILQLGIVYYGAKPIFGFPLDVWQAGILCFSMNSAAYVSEILRAGFASIPKIQYDASAALGIRKSLMIRDILLPQAIKTVLPALVNESIDLLKESAIISTISGVDIMRRAYIVASQHHLYFEPFIVAGCAYYVLVLCLSALVKFIAKRFG